MSNNELFIEIIGAIREDDREKLVELSEKNSELVAFAIANLGTFKLETYKCGTLAQPVMLTVLYVPKNDKDCRRKNRLDARSNDIKYMMTLFDNWNGYHKHFVLKEEKIRVE